jgi:hypothetical protein
MMVAIGGRAAQGDLFAGLSHSPQAGRTANGRPHIAPIGHPLTDLDIVTH